MIYQRRARCQAYALSLSLWHTHSVNLCSFTIFAVTRSRPCRHCKHELFELQAIEHENYLPQLPLPSLQALGLNASQVGVAKRYLTTAAKVQVGWPSNPAIDEVALSVLANPVLSPELIDGTEIVNDSSNSSDSSKSNIA
jgi:hypothetical protein